MNRKNIIIISISITAIIIGIVTFFIIKTYESKNTQSGINNNNSVGINVIDEIAVETSYKDEIRVSPNAKIFLKQYYKKCGHTIEEEYNVPEDIVNMTRDDVLRYYDDWTLNEFSKELVRISRTNNGKCNEHFIAKDTDGYIIIYSVDDKDNENIYKKTEIITKYLSSEDKDKLKNGIVIIGKEDLNIFLEDFE